MAAEPRTTMARRVGSPSHMVSSCSVPMTLTSWSVARGRPGSGNWTMSLWTTVSTAAARTSGGQVGAAQVGLHDVDALGELGVDRPRVDADDALDAGVVRQAAREPRAERVRHAGDEDAPAGHASPALRWRTGGGRPAAGRPAAARPAAGRPAARRPAALGRRALGRRGAPARRGAGRLELLDASLERLDALAQGDELVGARRAQVLERLAEAPGGGHELVGELLGALAGEAGLAGGRLDGLGRGGAHGVAAALLLLLVRRGVLLLLAGVLLGHGGTSLSSPAVTHLHPTAELAERALLPDDPGQALALTRVLYDETPRMFNHHRGLWGYTGVALDGAPLTVQSTGIGGPSAAIVVAELQRAGPAPRGAHRPRVGARRRAARRRARGGHRGARRRRRQPGARRRRADRARPGAHRRAARRPLGRARVGRRRARRERHRGRAGLRPRERRGARGGGARGHPRGVPGRDRGGGRSRRRRRAPGARARWRRIAPCSRARDPAGHGARPAGWSPAPAAGARVAGARLGVRRAQRGELLGDRVERRPAARRGARRGGRRRPRCPPGAGRPTAGAA